MLPRSINQEPQLELMFLGIDARKYTGKGEHLPRSKEHTFAMHSVTCMPNCPPFDLSSGPDGRNDRSQGHVHECL